MDFDKKLAEFDEKIIDALKDNTAMMKLATETSKDLLAVLPIFDVDVSQGRQICQIFTHFIDWYFVQTDTEKNEGLGSDRNRHKPWSAYKFAR